MKQLYCTSRVASRNIFAFLIFDPKRPFSKGYSLCIVAIFANLQNGLIFRILAVFWSCFLRGTTLLCF